METKDLAPWNWFKKNDYGDKNPSHWENNAKEMVRVFDDFLKDFGNFDNFLPRLLKGSSGDNLKALPRIDIWETQNEYIIEADLPGIDKKYIDTLLLKNNVLMIRGKKPTFEECKNRTYYKLERPHGNFERSINLPDNCDTNNINASFKDGTLSIKMPKKEPLAEEVKKLDIS